MFVEHLEANMCVHYHSIKIVWLLILCLVQKDGIFAKLFFNILSFAKLLNCTFFNGYRHSFKNSSTNNHYPLKQIENFKTPFCKVLYWTLEKKYIVKGTYI